HDPANAQVLDSLARVRDRRGDRRGALELLERSVRVAPQRSQGFNNLGILRALNREPELAERAFRRGLSFQPADSSLLLNLAHLLALQPTRGDEAIALYRRGITAAPDNVDAYLALATLLARAGRLGDAAAALGRAADLAPGNPTLRQQALRLAQEAARR
ncbi:MAG: tetratricopeptide repeat protein, partial [Myxococcota bacterium]|nr:tetratricopeptide repeat protein [Myxococcota bacterium]